jgi:type VI protein secretion system component Hcp
MDTLERLFATPPLYVSVGADMMSDYAAQLDGSVFGGIDLEGSIQVQIGEHELIYEDDTSADGAREGKFEPGSPAMFAELITRMRNLLASAMFCGTMRVIGEDIGEEEQKNLAQAIDDLGEEFFEITLENALVARMEQVARDDALGEGLQRILSTMREEGIKRGLNKEERDNMTIGDAFGLGEPGDRGS